MPTCKKCNSYFPCVKIIDGKERNFGHRKFCLECSPYRGHNTRDLTKPLTNKLCKACNTVKNIEYFYRQKRGKNIGKLTSYCQDCYRRESTKRARDNKKNMVELKGGKCYICGYSKCLDSLHFHHLDKNAKQFSISRKRFTKLKDVQDELNKCVLICANCHGEVHAGLVPLVGLEPT